MPPADSSSRFAFGFRSGAAPNRPGHLSWRIVLVLWRLTAVAGFVTAAAEPAYYARKLRCDRFGLVTTWIDGHGQHVYFDDLTYTCRQD